MLFSGGSGTGAGRRGGGDDDDDNYGPNAVPHDPDPYSVHHTHRTCGTDQCPFGLAVLQIIHDHFSLLDDQATIKDSSSSTNHNHDDDADHRTYLSSSSSSNRLWDDKLKHIPYNKTLEEWAGIPGDSRYSIQMNIVSRRFFVVAFSFVRSLESIIKCMIKWRRTNGFFFL
jgi:hypothetical protein